ncbi:MAG: hypothetical protein RMJ88_11015 [Thermogemmata sp.]|nr:hypothetical protein [Thermogemmata sp.]
MASISKAPSGDYRVQVAQGRSCYCGQVTDLAAVVRAVASRPAELVGVHVEHLLQAKMTGTALPPVTTARFGPPDRAARIPPG